MGKDAGDGHHVPTYPKRRMQEKVRQRQYVMTLHAHEEMNDDRLTIYDVERGHYHPLFDG